MSKPFATKLIALAAVTLLLPSAALAQSGAPLILLPHENDKAVATRTTATVFEQGKAKGLDRDFSLSIYDSFGRYHHHLTPDHDPAGPTLVAGYDFTYMSTRLQNSTFPDQLVDQSVSLGIKNHKLGDWSLAYQVGLGYAGDTPFGDGDAWHGLATVAGTYVFNNQRGSYEAITLLVDYDGNRTIFPDVPLPGFIYTKQYGPNLTLNLGFPFASVAWKPTEQVELSFLYALPDFFALAAKYNLTEKAALFLRYDGRTEAFHSDAFDNNLDRILYEQRRIEAGVELTLVKPAADTSGLTVAFDTAVGYAFSQEFSQGFDFRDNDEIFDPTDEPYIRFGLNLDF